jgi:tetratricopeptide (TPR) repeat protein
MECLRIRRVRLEVASTLYGLRLVSEKDNDYVQAQEYYEQVLTIRKAKLGVKGGVQMAQTLTNLGAVFGNMGEYQKALTQWDSALTLYLEARYPKEDPAAKAIIDNIQQAKQIIAESENKELESS